MSWRTNIRESCWIRRWRWRKRSRSSMIMNSKSPKNTSNPWQVTLPLFRNRRESSSRARPLSPQHERNQDLRLKPPEQVLRHRINPPPEVETSKKVKRLRIPLTLVERLPALAVKQGRHLQQNLHPNHKLNPPPQLKRNQAQVAKNEASGRSQRDHRALDPQQRQHQLQQPPLAEQPRQEDAAAAQEHQDPLINLYAFQPISIIFKLFLKWPTFKITQISSEASISHSRKGTPLLTSGTNCFRIKRPSSLSPIKKQEPPSWAWSSMEESCLLPTHEQPEDPLLLKRTARRYITSLLTFMHAGLELQPIRSL